jgi:hypothetical protein
LYVRELSSKIVDAFEGAVQYTHIARPTQQEFGKALGELSAAIELLRSVFSNYGETTEHQGLFPFESLKLIHGEIGKLGFYLPSMGNSAMLPKAKLARSSIINHWKKLRRHYLNECARGLPTSTDSPYLKG